MVNLDGRVPQPKRCNSYLSHDQKNEHLDGPQHSSRCAHEHSQWSFCAQSRVAAQPLCSPGFPRRRCSLVAESRFLMSAAEFCGGALPPPAEDQKMRKESRGQETSHPKLAGVEAVCTPSSSGSLVLAVLCRQCRP